MTGDLKIAYSPCPNDTFVFDALAHGRVPGAPALDVTFADIDITNGMAERGESDVLKVSYAVLPYVLDEYALLPCGGALGRGCGPLVLTRYNMYPAAGITGPRTASSTGRSTHTSTPPTASTIAEVAARSTAAKRVIARPVTCWAARVAQRGPPTA